MPVSDWTASEDWEVLHLGGQRMPGVARVEVSLPGGLDVKKAKGAKRARLVDTGSPPAHIDIELELLPSEMADLESVIRTLRPRGAASAHEPLEITHPNTKLWGVGVVKVADISSPMPKPGGTLVLKIKAIEHVEQPKAVKKPASAKPLGDHDGNDTQPLIDALQSSPAKQSAAANNFSSSPPIEGSGF